MGIVLKLLSMQVETTKIDKGELISEYLSLNDAQKVRNYPTTLKRPSESDFDLILKHGYEVAKCTYQCYK